MTTDVTASATGRRKEAVAVIRMRPGKGAFTINGKDLFHYLGRETLVMHALAPLETTAMVGKVDVTCRARGGGLSGQAGAVRLGLARALVKLDPELRTQLKKDGFLTRDSRMVERKKYGLVKARKRFQFSKR